MPATLQIAGLSTDRGFVALLDEARRGSAEAIGKLWALCRLQLLATANDELSDDVRAKAGASDVVQETFLRAQRALSRFTGDTPDALLAWLRTILRNHLSNVRRRFHTGKREVGRERSLAGVRDDRKSRDVADAAPSPGSVCIEQEQAQRVSLAMERLSGDYRRVIELRYWKQLTFPEIGRELKRTSEAARKLWARALLKLQQELDHGSA